MTAPGLSLTLLKSDCSGSLLKRDVLVELVGLHEALLTATVAVEIFNFFMSSGSFLPLTTRTLFASNHANATRRKYIVQSPLASRLSASLVVAKNCVQTVFFRLV